VTVLTPAGCPSGSPDVVFDSFGFATGFLTPPLVFFSFPPSSFFFFAL